MCIIGAVDMLFLSLRSINAAFVVAVQQPPNKTCATNSKCISNASLAYWLALPCRLLNPLWHFLQPVVRTLLLLQPIKLQLTAIRLNFYCAPSLPTPHFGTFCLRSLCLVPSPSSSSSSLCNRQQILLRSFVGYKPARAHFAFI